MERHGRFPSLPNVAIVYNQSTESSHYVGLESESGRFYEVFNPATRRITDPLAVARVGNLNHKLRRLRELRSVKRKLRHIFIALIVVCFILFGTFVYVFAKSKRDSPTQSSSSADHRDLTGGDCSSLSPKGDDFCFNNDDIHNYYYIWKKYSYTRKENKTCFRCLSWIPRIVTMIDTDVTNELSTKGDNGKAVDSNNKSKTDDGDGVSLRRPCAHLFLNGSAKYQGDDKIQPPLVFSSKKTKNSMIHDMELDSRQEGLIITHSGYYFIYSHVLFSTNTQSRLHAVFKNYRSDGRIKLLESNVKNETSSFLQGIFLLQSNDSLVIVAPTDLLNTTVQTLTYFGAYKL